LFVIEYEITFGHCSYIDIIIAKLIMLMPWMVEELCLKSMRNVHISRKFLHFASWSIFLWE